MKKIVSRIAFLLVVLFLPLFTMGCPCDCAKYLRSMDLNGTFKLNGETLNVDLYTTPQTVTTEALKTPYIFVSPLEGTIGSMDCSFYLTKISGEDGKYCFQLAFSTQHFDDKDMTAVDILNKTVFSVTYVPANGENITVSSSGIVWEVGKQNFTVDFTNGTFTVE